MPTATAQPYDDEDDDLEHSEVADHLDSIIRLRSHQSGDSYWGDPNNIQDRAGERMQENEWTDRQHAAWRLHSLQTPLEVLTSSLVVAVHMPRNGRNLAQYAACDALHANGYSFRAIGKCLNCDQENARRYCRDYRLWRRRLIPHSLRSSMSGILNSLFMNDNDSTEEEAVLRRVEAAQATIRSMAAISLDAAKNAHMCSYDPASVLAFALYQGHSKLRGYTNRVVKRISYDSPMALSGGKLLDLLGGDLVFVVGKLVIIAEDSYESLSRT
jgi:hypothetical protein